jgi:hypothetical protein
MGIGVAALLEIGGALCLPRVFFLIYGACWTLPFLPALFHRPAVLKFAVYGVFVASLVVLYAVPWNSRKVFLHDLDKVRTGMSVEEVESIMGTYMKGTGWPAGPASSSDTLTEVGTGIRVRTSVSPSGELEVDDSIVYRHSNDAAFNSDWGIVKFKDGKVVETVFMPD